MTKEWHPTALYVAAEAGHLEVVKFILEHRVDINAKAGCALTAAVYHGQIEVAEYLLNHGANPNAHDHILHCAVRGGLVIVKLLIDKGANLQVQGEDALKIASIYGKLDIVKLLIEKGNGADVNVLVRGHRTALGAAIEGEEHITVQFLIDSGTDINASTGRFWDSTPS
ncbi:ankyrin repeat domain-containing protein [Mycena floridula]|nr:ankyrin repeat domain-containing protein [Mycena floridula]